MLFKFSAESTRVLLILDVMIVCLRLFDVRRLGAVNHCNDLKTMQCIHM